jgi:hypothetical protein
MDRTCQAMAALVCLLSSLYAGSQPGDRTRKIALPSPQLIHCRSSECSKLWNQESSDAGTVYPAQVLTDLVNGEVVGLTAVYDKSVSKSELRDAINKLYDKSKFQIASDIWRVESEQVAISIFDGNDGAKEVTYLKFGSYASHAPSAHLECPDKPIAKPPFLP